ncbi:MAG TPA: NAD-dependent epimerase/dehydratase family protein [Vicinamibacterales bacterium]
MVVAITGASGFIGSLLMRRHLNAGDQVRILTRGLRRQPVTSGTVAFHGDFAQPDHADLRRFIDGIDVLYHCAAEIRDSQRMQAVNVDGTRALLAAAEGRVGRWVQLSSVGVYGHHVDDAVVEETPLAPVGMYEATKAAADALVLEAASRGRLSAVVVRPSIVFGEHMPNQSIAEWARVIDRGVFFFIGSPGASANYVHVANVVDALMTCGRSAAADGRIYNVSDWCTIEAFAHAIADALGRPRPSVRLPEQPVRAIVRTLGRVARLPLTESRIDALVTRRRYPIDRIERELGYRIAVPIVDGITRMLAARQAA